MDNNGGRREMIVAAITAELHRQVPDGASRVDIDALAQAIEDALEPTPPASEGRHPDELNATNDD